MVWLEKIVGLFRTTEVRYILLIFGLFVVPRVLQRWRLPSAITCFGIGALAGMGLHTFQSDSTIPLLAALGIATLFLFAGLEVEFHELRRGWRIITQHVAIQLLLLTGTTLLASQLLELDIRPALLFSLALVTPSTGFILDSLSHFGLDQDQRFWVKSKAIAVEIVALVVLLITVQSVSAVKLLISLAVLAAMVLLLPVAFRLFANRILPYAPKSEFTFLVIISLVCAVVTRQLGVYYLVGAFVVGLTAQRFRELLPNVASAQCLHSIELFASFFIPFYFFKAGLHLTPDDFTWTGVGIGLICLIFLIPIRVGLVILHRARTMKRPLRMAARVGASMIPTLVFTLVLADILRERFDLPSYLYGALVIYALGNTIFPGLVLGTPPPEYDLPEIPLEVADSHPDPAVDSATSDGLSEGAATEPVGSGPGSDEVVR